MTSSGTQFGQNGRVGLYNSTTLPPQFSEVKYSKGEVVAGREGGVVTANAAHTLLIPHLQPHAAAPGSL